MEESRRCPSNTLGVGAAFLMVISFAPVVIGILILVHIRGTLDAIRTDVRRIADQLDRDDQLRSRP